MKKVASYTLLILFLFNTCGFYVAYVFIHNEDRAEFASFVKENNFSKFETLNLTNAEMANTAIFQRKNKGEFLYKGKMFDIVRQSKTKNGTCFYCYNDENDSVLSIALTKHINHFVKDNNQNNNQKNNFLNTILNKLYYNNHLNNLTVFEKTIDSKNNFLNRIYNSPYGKIQAPPPKYFFA